MNPSKVGLLALSFVSRTRFGIGIGCSDDLDVDCVVLVGLLWLDL